MKKLIFILLCLSLFNYGFTKHEKIKIKANNVKTDIKSTNTKSVLPTTINSKTSGEFLIKTQDLNKIKNKKIIYTDNSISKIQADEKTLKSNKIQYQPNYIYYKTNISNDTYFNKQRALLNTGQNINNIKGISGSDIGRIQAKSLIENISGNNIIAIIDDGIGYYHTEFNGILWDGANCKNENGIEINHCKHGYDFENNDKDPLANTTSHGTHIAGIIAAQSNNNFGIVGVSNHLKIMALKAGNEYLTTDKIIKSIKFAQQNGVKIINASFGSRGLESTSILENNYDYLLYEAIKEFGENGGLFITSAGNGGKNHDSGNISDKFYPADFSQNTVFPNGESFDGIQSIITVGANDQNDNLADYSDFGKNSVHILAPGSNIISTVLSGELIFNENFNNINNLSGYLTGSISGNNNWGISNVWEGDNILRTDKYAPNYQNNSHTFLQLPKIDTTNNKGIKIQLWGWCHSENSPSNRTDYVSILGSTNGTDFTEIGRFDYASDQLYSPLTIFGKRGYQGYLEYEIPQNFTNQYYIRFDWVTDESDNTYAGCGIDDIEIVGYDGGIQNRFEYMNGTSMASPYVAATAGLARLINPQISNIQLKNSILMYSETTSGAIQTTISGKRLDLNNVLKNLLKPQINNVSIYSNGKNIVNNSYTNVGNINIQIDGTSFSGLYYYSLLGENNFISGNSENKLISGIQLTNNDIYKIKIHGVSNSGITGNIYESSFIYDNLPPNKPIILSLYNQKIITTNNLNINRNNSNDNIGTKIGYNIVIENLSENKYIYSGTTYNTGITLESLGNGIYSLKINTFDEYNNQSDYNIIEFIVNNTSKYIELNGGDRINSINQNNITFELNGVENIFGNAVYKITDIQNQSISGEIILNGESSYNISGLNLSLLDEGIINSNLSIFNNSGDQIEYLTSFNLKDSKINGCLLNHINTSGTRLGIEIGCAEYYELSISNNQELITSKNGSGFSNIIINGRYGINNIQINYLDNFGNKETIEKIIEIINNTQQPINLSGNQITGGINITTGGNTNIENPINSNTSNNSSNTNNNNISKTIISQPIITTNLQNNSNSSQGGGEGGGISIYNTQTTKDKSSSIKKIIKNTTKTEKIKTPGLIEKIKKLNYILANKLKKSTKSYKEKLTIIKAAEKLYKGILNKQDNYKSEYYLIYNFLKIKQ